MEQQIIEQLSMLIAKCGHGSEVNGVDSAIHSTDYVAEPKGQ